MGLLLHLCSSPTRKMLEMRSRTPFSVPVNVTGVRSCCVRQYFFPTSVTQYCSTLRQPPAKAGSSPCSRREPQRCQRRAPRTAGHSSAWSRDRGQHNAGLGARRGAASIWISGWFLLRPAAAAHPSARLVWPCEGARSRGSPRDRRGSGASPGCGWASARQPPLLLLLLCELPVPGKLRQQHTDAKGSLQEANPSSGAQQGSPLLCPGLHPSLPGALQS